MNFSRIIIFIISTQWIYAFSLSGVIYDAHQKRVGNVSIIISDTTSDSNIATIEVHLSNIHSREKFRSTSIIAPISIGQISGLGKKGYIFALKHLIDQLNSK